MDHRIEKALLFRAKSFRSKFSLNALAQEACFVNFTFTVYLIETTAVVSVNKKPVDAFLEYYCSPSIRDNLVGPKLTFCSPSNTSRFPANLKRRFKLNWVW